MDTEATDFPDWELLTEPDDSEIINSSDSSGSFYGLDQIEHDDSGGGGLIKFDYFSIDPPHTTNNYAASDDKSSVQSDNPSWIDPSLDTVNRFVRKESVEFWTDSSSNLSDDRKFGDFEVNNDLGIVEMAPPLDVIGEIGAESENSVKFSSDSDSRIEVNGEVVDDLKGEKLSVKSENFEIEAMKPGSGEGKRVVEWWKLPLDLMKYCLFKASPVWTISMAAAMMGFLILGRRLYMMKRKTKNLKMKVTLDDKKVSQFMTRAARLNEAFSVVKRVPIIRPSLPASGVAPWPMMSLR